MSPAFHRISRNAALLTTMIVWLISVTLCSTEMEPAESPEHADSIANANHGGHSDDHDHHGPTQDDDCSCQSFKTFPADAAALAKAPLPSTPLLLYTIPLVSYVATSAATTITPQSRGPPGQHSFAEQIIQRCLLSHAPPLLV